MPWELHKPPGMQESRPETVRRAGGGSIRVTAGLSEAGDLIHLFQKGFITESHIQLKWAKSSVHCVPAGPVRRKSPVKCRRRLVQILQLVPRRLLALHLSLPRNIDDESNLRT